MLLVLVFNAHEGGGGGGGSGGGCCCCNGSKVSASLWVSPQAFAFGHAKSFFRRSLFDFTANVLTKVAVSLRALESDVRSFSKRSLFDNVSLVSFALFCFSANVLTKMLVSSRACAFVDVRRFFKRRLLNKVSKDAFTCFYTLTYRSFNTLSDRKTK